MTDHTNAMYTENKIDLSWLIRLGAIYDENQTGQECDRLYRCS